MNAAAKIGLFALIGLIILGFFILRIENLPLGSGGDVVMVEARFASAAGVDRKAPVRIAGVRVGQVGTNPPGRPAGGAGDLAGSGRSLHEGASAQVVNMGILGDKYVEIVPGDATRPLLPAGTQLVGQAAPSIDEVMEIATSHRRRRQGGHRRSAHVHRRRPGSGQDHRDRGQHPGTHRNAEGAHRREPGQRQRNHRQLPRRLGHLASTSCRCWRRR
jgi:hypothetical protein